jgi:hypothetical protein
MPDVSTQGGLRVTGRQMPDVSTQGGGLRVTGQQMPTFRQRVVVSNPKEEKIKKNDFTDFSTI